LYYELNILIKFPYEQRGYASFCKANCSGRKDFLDR